MAVGDVVADTQNKADDAALTIQPAGTEEWVIHNIHFEGIVEISDEDGANSLIFHTSVAGETEYTGVWHVTNSDYIAVTNRSGGAIDIHYDGVITAV